MTYLLREVWRGFSARADRVVAPGGDKGLMRATAHLTFTRWVAWGLGAGWGPRGGWCGSVQCTHIGRGALVGRAVQGSPVAANALPGPRGMCCESCVLLRCVCRAYRSRASAHVSYGWSNPFDTCRTSAH